jgi:hydroxymethylpyrimidine kinase/phosphomethylpyrimidine kinase
MAGTLFDKLLGFDDDGGGNRRAAVACSVSVHDPLGARYLSADARTFGAVGVHPVLVATGVRARGPLAGVWPLPGEIVEAQLAAAWASAPPDALKIGSVESVDAIFAVGQALGDGGCVHTVLDPELVEKTGAPLASDEVTARLVADLLPLCEVVVLNPYEATAVSGVAARTSAGLREAMRAVYDLGAQWVVGHALPDEPHAVDWLYDGRGFVEFGADWLSEPFVVGAGCVFSAGLTAHLARGAEVMDAVDSAKQMVTDSIRFGVAVAVGVGPANPMGPVYRSAGLAYAAIEERAPE